MLETSWLWFVISKEYVELTRPKIESRDPIFFTGTRLRSRVSGNDRLFPRGSEFGPNLEIPAGPAIQLRPGPGYWISVFCYWNYTVVTNWLPWLLKFWPNYWNLSLLCGVWLAESSCAPTLWRHDHKSTTKTWWSCRSLGVDSPCLGKKICHQNTMLMRWKVCNFKDEDLKILGREDSSWNSAPFFL